MTYPASTGDLSVTVTGVDCTQTMLVPDSFSAPAIAQGRWCIVSIGYTNNGIAPATPAGFTLSSTLHDDAGRLYGPDIIATSHAERIEASARGLSENLVRVNPGQSTFIALAFDVPTDAVPARIDLQNAGDETVASIDLTGAIP